MNPKTYLVLLLIPIFLTACFAKKKENKLIIFHAGSLSLPFKQISQAFEEKYPDVYVELEAAGSISCARKITDLNKPCDIMASADYMVIDNLLIPKFSSQNIKFATNEMALAYSNTSKRQQEINEHNWLDIILDDNINYGRSDPNSDPCGYRTVLISKLIEKFYKRPGIADSILLKNNEHIRPKEVDLLALLEANVIDYVFIYRSVAEQHGLNYLILPDSINLKSIKLKDFYKTVSVTVSGKKPGETTTYHGEPIAYGITQINNGPNPELAKLFFDFFFIDSVGIKIMEANGQESFK